MLKGQRSPEEGCTPMSIGRERSSSSFWEGVGKSETPSRDCDPSRVPGKWTKFWISFLEGNRKNRSSSAILNPQAEDLWSNLRSRWPRPTLPVFHGIVDREWVIDVQGFPLELGRPNLEMVLVLEAELNPQLPGAYWIFCHPFRNKLQPAQRHWGVVVP